MSVKEYPTSFKVGAASGPPGAPGRKGRLRRVVRRVPRLTTLVGPLAVFVALLGVWYLLGLVLLAPHRRFLVPPPHDVVLAMIRPESSSELLNGLWQTTRVSMTGLALSIAVGGTLAIMMSQARWIERSFFPYAVLLQVMPTLAMVPLIGLAFGFNFKSRVLVSMIISLFPIITNTLFGLKSATTDTHDLFTLQRASRWQRFWKLQFRAAQPAIFTGLRISAGLSVIGAIVGDFFFRQGVPGLGVLLDRYRTQLATEKLYGAIFCAALLGLAVFLFFSFLARKVVGPWHEAYGRGELAA